MLLQGPPPIFLMLCAAGWHIGSHPVNLALFLLLLLVQMQQLLNWPRVAETVERMHVSGLMQCAIKLVQVLHVSMVLAASGVLQ